MMLENTQKSANSSDFLPCYREAEKNRIVAALQADSSLLVVGAAGIGKTTLCGFVVRELRALGFPVANIAPSTAKNVMIEIAAHFSLIGLEGKIPTTVRLQQIIAEFLLKVPAFIVIDDAQRLPVSLRSWLETLLASGQRILLFAAFPPARDIFLKLPRIELKPLKNKPIRELMETAARELDIELTPAQFSMLQERCGGNPMLARRVVREEFLGLDDTSPDHTQWINGTPMLIAGLMIFAVLRFVGRGLHSTDLYLIGGCLTVAVGIVRVLIYSLPRKSTKLGG